MTTPELRQKNEKGKKFCIKCKTWVPMSGFGTDNSKPDKKKGKCKDCVRDYQKDYYKRPEVIEREKQRNKQRVKRGDFRKKKPCAIAGGFRAQ